MLVVLIDRAREERDRERERERERERGIISIIKSGTRSPHVAGMSIRSKFRDVRRLEIAERQIHPLPPPPPAPPGRTRRIKPAQFVSHERRDLFSKERVIPGERAAAFSSRK